MTKDRDRLPRDLPLKEGMKSRKLQGSSTFIYEEVQFDSWLSSHKYKTKMWNQNFDDPLKRIREFYEESQETLESLGYPIKGPFLLDSSDISRGSYRFLYDYLIKEENIKPHSLVAICAQAIKKYQILGLDQNEQSMKPNNSPEKQLSLAYELGLLELQAWYARNQKDIKSTNAKQPRNKFKSEIYNDLLSDPENINLGPEELWVKLLPILQEKECEIHFEDSKRIEFTAFDTNTNKDITGDFKYPSFRDRIKAKNEKPY